MRSLLAVWQRTRFGCSMLTRQDIRYLTPYVEEVKKAEEEREKWDTMKIKH